MYQEKEKKNTTISTSYPNAMFVPNNKGNVEMFVSTISLKESPIWAKKCSSGIPLGKNKQPPHSNHNEKNCQNAC